MHAVPQLERSRGGAKFLSDGALKMLTTIFSYCDFKFGLGVGAKFVLEGAPSLRSCGPVCMRPLILIVSAAFCFS